MWSLVAALWALLLTSSSPVESSAITSQASIHDILAHYGLPVGLLPDTVKSYSLSEDGHFVVELEKTCYVQFNYLVYYDRTIKGKLSYGRITDLSGIQAEEFIIWVHVTGIKVDVPNSGYIYFQIGAISKKIEISWFDSVPSCKNSLGKGKEPCNTIAQREIQ